MEGKMKKIFFPVFVLFTLFSIIFSIPATAASNQVALKGNATHGGGPVCAMVLANGQYVFYVDWADYDL
jgi:hypothetical protein